jgi:hypothetical protein
VIRHARVEHELIQEICIHLIVAVRSARFKPQKISFSDPELYRKVLQTFRQPDAIHTLHPHEASVLRERQNQEEEEEDEQGEQDDLNEISRELPLQKRQEKETFPPFAVFGGVNIVLLQRNPRKRRRGLVFSLSRTDLYRALVVLLLSALLFLGFTTARRELFLSQ